MGELNDADARVLIEERTEWNGRAELRGVEGLRGFVYSCLADVAEVGTSVRMDIRYQMDD